MKSVNVSGLKNNPSEALRQAQKEPVIVFNRDQPQALLVALDSLDIPSNADLKLALAFALLKDQSISVSAAARMLGLSREAFMELAKQRTNPPIAGTVENQSTSEVQIPDTVPLVERLPLVWTITLRRPRQHNRLDPADVDLLQITFEELRRTSPRPRVLIFRGTGNVTFSSGYTLQSIVGELDERFETMLDNLETLPIFTIAAMQGSVYGGATDLALCCDVRLGPPHARMFMPAARIGLHYYPQGMRRYLSRLGYAAASKLFLTAMPVHAEELLRIGFFHELVAPDQLDERLKDHVEAVLATDSGVVETMKATLFEMASLPDSVLETARQRYQTSLRSPQLVERLAALGK